MMEEDMQRYFDTFFVMLKDAEFSAKVEASEGVCMYHFRQILEKSGDILWLPFSAMGTMVSNNRKSTIRKDHAF